MSHVSEPVDWLNRLCNGTSTTSTRTSEELVAAGILLPPYFTHDSFYNNIAIVAATLYCWEYLMTAPAEIRIYFTIPWNAPHLIFFVLMRYTTLIAITLGLYATWHRQRGNCVAYSDVATLLVQLSVSAVLGWRTIAIWQKDARIIVIIFLLITTLMVFSSLLVLNSKPQKLRNGACIFVKGGNYEFFPLAWFYAGSVLYDTTVIVLSTYRLWQHHKDVGVFPGANLDNTSKGGISWARWVHSQWNSITPLLFRLTSNGVLYLAFSTVFNVVCFILGHWNEDRAQDLLLLYSSVMWVVCQHLVLLEIRATWGDRPMCQKFGLKDGTNDDTDGLITRILQASGECKSPSWDTKAAGAVQPYKPADPKLIPSLSLEDYHVRGPLLCDGARCTGSPLANESTLPRRLQQHAVPMRAIRRFSLGGELHDDLSRSSVQQLHDFRPPLPGESYDGFGARSVANSERVDTTDGNASTSVLIARSDEALSDDRRASIRQRLGALCGANSPNKLLATLTKVPTRSDATTGTAACPATTEFVHPLMEPPPAIHTAPQQHDSTSSRLGRFSQAFERAHKNESGPKIAQHPASAASAQLATLGSCCCRYENAASISDATARLDEITQSRKSASPRDRISSLEVADMLATMSDDAKTKALALAGMEGAEPLPSCSSFTSPRTKANRPTWIIHPPL